ncbi:MAG: hypothetical protein JSS07_04410 [Proteobacteria bacterium]|nr:hypothetical protein [Pseudomonadota bacterium]
MLQTTHPTVDFKPNGSDLEKMEAFGKLPIEVFNLICDQLISTHCKDVAALAIVNKPMQKTIQQTAQFLLQKYFPYIIKHPLYLNNPLKLLGFEFKRYQQELPHVFSTLSVPSIPTWYSVDFSLLREFIAGNHQIISKIQAADAYDGRFIRSVLYGLLQNHNPDLVATTESIIKQENDIFLSSHTVVKAAAFAAANGQLDILKALLLKLPSFVNHNYLCAIAINQGQLAIVKEIFNTFSIHPQGNDIKEASEVALHRGYFDVVQYIVSLDKAKALPPQPTLGWTCGLLPELSLRDFLVDRLQYLPTKIVNRLSAFDDFTPEQKQIIKYEKLLRETEGTDRDEKILVQLFDEDDDDVLNKNDIAEQNRLFQEKQKLEKQEKEKKLLEEQQKLEKKEKEKQLRLNKFFENLKRRYSPTVKALITGLGVFCLTYFCVATWLSVFCFTTIAVGSTYLLALKYQQALIKTFTKYADLNEIANISDNPSIDALDFGVKAKTRRGYFTSFGKLPAYSRMTLFDCGLTYVIENDNEAVAQIETLKKSAC